MQKRSFYQDGLGTNIGKALKNETISPGKKGDVIIWHGGLMHSGSMNCSSTPRLALFGSFRHAGAFPCMPRLFYAMPSFSKCFFQLNLNVCQDRLGTNQIHRKC